MSLAICGLVQNLSTAIGLAATRIQSWPVRANFGKNTILLNGFKTINFFLRPFLAILMKHFIAALVKLDEWVGSKFIYSNWFGSYARPKLASQGKFWLKHYIFKWVQNY